MELGLALSMVQKRQSSNGVGQFESSHYAKTKVMMNYVIYKRTNGKVSRVYRVEREGCVVLIISITPVFLLWSQHKPRIAL